MLNVTMSWEGVRECLERLRDGYVRGQAGGVFGADGHRFEIFYEQDRYVPPEELRPRLKNVPQRHVDRGAAVKRIDHVNVLASDVAANRRFARARCVIHSNICGQGKILNVSIGACKLSCWRVPHLPLVGRTPTWHGCTK